MQQQIGVLSIKPPVETAAEQTHLQNSNVNERSWSRATVIEKSNEQLWIEHVKQENLQLQQRVKMPFKKPPVELASEQTHPQSSQVEKLSLSRATGAEESNNQLTKKPITAEEKAAKHVEKHAALQSLTSTLEHKIHWLEQENAQLNGTLQNTQKILDLRTNRLKKVEQTCESLLSRWGQKIQRKAEI